MKNQEVISIITKCAVQYASNLCDRQLAFVYQNADNQPKYIEVSFRSYHFMHFTGIITRNQMSANTFYKSALEQRLKESDIIFKNGYTTRQKLQILHKINHIAYCARMIGDYIGPHLNLYTEKITGTTSACLGLIKSNQTYIPNTVLNEDIRNITPKPPGKIFAIFRKPIHSEKYNELTYQSPNIPNLPKYLPAKLRRQIEPALLEKLS